MKFYAFDVETVFFNRERLQKIENHRKDVSTLFC